jgi:transposase-like protein
MMKRKPVGRPMKKSIEYMMMVCKEVEGGMTYKQAAKTFDVSQGTLSQWVKKYRAGKLGEKVSYETESAKTQRLEENIHELKSEIAELYLQNQVLKKAITYTQKKRKLATSVITSENLDQFREDVD